MTRLYTPEELASETRSLSEMALEELDRGNLDQVRFLVGRMSVGHFELYFGYIDWITRLAGKVFRDLGDGYLDETSRKIARFLMAPYARDLQNGDEARTIVDILTLWRHQLGRIELLEETSKEISFLMGPCGSGGRLLLASLYEARPWVYPRSGDGSPLFCRICRHLQEALNELADRDFWSAVPDPQHLGSCRMRFSKHITGGTRLFDRGKARALLLGRCDQALERLERAPGDAGNIKDLLRDQHTEWRPLHDLLNLWVTALFSSIYEDRGLAYLAELVWETYVPMFEATYRMYSAMDTRSLLRNLARLWYYHQATFHVTEEEDRFVFHLDPCGSGGRLYRGEALRPGLFRYGNGLLRQITDADDITFGRAPFPIYCTHCAATNRVQFEGKPWTFIVDGEAMCKPEDPCVQYLYKKEAPRAAPPHLLRQVGLKEAKPLDKEYFL